MAPILGRTQVVGLGKETTPGTAVAATDWLPFQELTIEDVKDAIFDNSALGTRYDNFGQDTDMERAEGNLNGLIYPNLFGRLLHAAMGGVSTAAHGTATGAYVHTFSVANTLPSYTIAKEDAHEDVRHSYGTLNTLEITVEQGQYASFSSAWLARKSVSASNTAAFTTEKAFRPQDVVVKIADTVAGLGAAAALRFRSLTLSINNNVMTEPSLGTVQPDFYPGVVQTSLSFSGLYLNTDFKDLVFDNSPKALSITFTRSDVSIGTGTPTNPSLVFTFEPGFFSAWNREGGLDDLKTENVSYAPIFSTSASKQFGAVATNTKASY